MFYITKNMITIGTDCSGIEAPIMALRQMKIPHKHLWSCDVDKFVRQSIQANYNPKIIYKDIKQKRYLPKVDIYVAGFPCQAFSYAGKRLGTNDPRGTIFWDCVKAIKQSKPKVFILENVKGLLSIDNGNTFNTIMMTLKSLKKYEIHYKVLNTKDYGIPQNRERVFIIGFDKSYIKKDKQFKWAKKKKMKDINKYVDWSNTKRSKLMNCMRETYYADKYPKSVFIDLSFIKFGNALSSYEKYSPTICACNIMWCVSLHRHATIKELLKLQGFPSNFKQVVSKTQMFKQIGNSMSVNVIKEIYKCIFEYIII